MLSNVQSSTAEEKKSLNNNFIGISANVRYAIIAILGNAIFVFILYHGHSYSLQKKLMAYGITQWRVEIRISKQVCRLQHDIY